VALRICGGASVADATDALPDELFLLAGEHALGVLEGEQLSEAHRLQLSDPRFADAVIWWQWRFGVLSEGADAIEPSPGIWRAIEMRIRAQNDNRPSSVDGTKGKVSPLSIAALAGGAMLAAASLALFLATPKVDSDGPPIAETPEPARSPQLVAQIADDDAGRSLATIIDEGSGRISLSIDGLEAGEGQTPELWVIPSGGSPVSLGAIPESGAYARELSANERRLLVDGASLAVTFEEDTGTRHAEPTPPILLVGPLDQA